MARTIAEIQQNILLEKEKHAELAALTSTSKSAIWRLWTYIVSTAIWMHEKIVERNALLSRPHTLNWYREQALNFINGKKLEWKDGYFQYPELTQAEISKNKIVKHCAISERLYENVQDKIEQDNGELSNLISEYYYYQVGIITLKVAKEGDGGEKVPLTFEEQTAFKAYMNNIKDAGTQIRVQSRAGNSIKIKVDVYVDPLIIYTEGENAGKLLSNLSVSPVVDAIKAYVTTLEFNGAFVPTYLIDNIQQAYGVKLPILRKVEVDGTDSGVDGKLIYNDADNSPDVAFFVPSSGYFRVVNKEDLDITYKPYNLQTDNNFTI